MNGFNVAMRTLFTERLFVNSSISREKHDAWTIFIILISALSISLAHNGPRFLGSRKRKHNATILNNRAYEEYFLSISKSHAVVFRQIFFLNSGISSSLTFSLCHLSSLSNNHGGPENHN